jgi:hypothetical protein
LRSVLNAEAAGRRRDVVVLAIDGIPHALGAAAWRHARVSPLETVFPSASAPAWLTSLTGAQVSDHGVPGVVFRGPSGALVNVLECRDDLALQTGGNLFTDARRAGYLPLVVVGDWEPYDCAFRDALFRGAVLVRGHRFYTGARPRRAMARHIASAVETALASSVGPRLVWCFVDVDQHVHGHGYDDHVQTLLGEVDQLALDWTAAGRVVLAHSDHGLVKTRHLPELAKLFEDLGRRGCAVGGAGRTRWLYPDPGSEDAIFDSVTRAVPASVSVYPSARLWSRDSVAFARVGAIVLVAEGDEFVTFHGHTYEHGSWTAPERRVPFASWPAGT